MKEEIIKYSSQIKDSILEELKITRDLILFEESLKEKIESLTVQKEKEDLLAEIKELHDFIGKFIENDEKLIDAYSNILKAINQADK